MEHTQYSMWCRKSSDQRSLVSSSVHTVSAACLYSESWEERAFAQDSAGKFLGGCTWPPTTYTCSFCRREFRSAQALGGHMNVHRRDRARLKQSSSSARLENNSSDLSHNPSPLMNLSCTEAKFRPNPNCSLIISSFSHKAPVAFTKEANRLSFASSPSFSSSSVQENQFEANTTAIPPSFIDATAGKQYISTPQPNHDRENLKMSDLGYYLVPIDTDDDNEGIIYNKRRRIDGVFPFFERTSSNIQGQVQSEVLRLSSSPVEELDLELRLGCHAKLPQNFKDIVVVE